MIIPISYPLSRTSPLYPGTPELSIQPFKSINTGSSSNSSIITHSSHAGTHIDVPFHFCHGGKTVADCFTYGSTFFPAYCIDIGKPNSQEIGTGDLGTIVAGMTDAQALFIRTGWDTIRVGDPYRYSHENICVSPEVPTFLREHCPYLRVFGIDQISISSVRNRDAGRECHRKFLCDKKPILLLEDCNLSDIRIFGKFRLHIFPYITDEIDGVPVVAFLERDDER